MDEQKANAKSWLEFVCPSPEEEPQAYDAVQHLLSLLQGQEVVALREMIRAFFRERYGDHAPDRWEQAACGREKGLALALPDHPRHRLWTLTYLNPQEDGE